MLFEALGGMGVTLTDWKDFMEFKWYSAYQKIVYRKLNCKRTPEMLTEFENFIKVQNHDDITAADCRNPLENHTKSRLQSYVVIKRRHLRIGS